jgi:two-component system cell cycle response regulator DivK
MKKILVIEDNDINQLVVSRFLERGGYTVIQAKDGLAGVKKAKSERPDLILMDLNLPELDGWEATRRIKNHADTCGIPIIALTAHAFQADITSALQAGCDEYETKPVMYGRLMTKISLLLAAREEDQPTTTR